MRGGVAVDDVSDEAGAFAFNKKRRMNVMRTQPLCFATIYRRRPCPDVEGICAYLSGES